MPFQRHESVEVDEIIPSMRIRGTASAQNTTRFRAPGLSSRMSMERYLSAPLSDEPASVPAITAALRKQATPESRTQFAHEPQAQHSRDTSADANSDGRRTFFTMGSVPDTVDTSYSIHSKTNQQRSLPQATVIIPPTLQRKDSDRSTVSSPVRPTTSGTVGPVDMARNWAEQMEKYMPGFSPDQRIDYRAKADAEIARIQEMARQLEGQIRQYKAERDAGAAAVVTNEMAYAQMAAHPKLAWILGGDTADGRSIGRPKSIASTTDDLPDRPSTAGKALDISKERIPRRSKSSGALDERARQSAVDKNAARTVERKASKRPKFYCTFCQKRFHSRLEWMRHEHTIHMPEELWICCPRTGEYPDRCPFCEKANPSPAHLADHNYLSCQGKPLSERTFGRKGKHSCDVSYMNEN